jgi:hypothetical protein
MVPAKPREPLDYSTIELEAICRALDELSREKAEAALQAKPDRSRLP